MAAIVYDQRGHGDTGGEMTPDAVNDVARMARVLGSETGVDPTRIAVRGSSMGGYLAIQAAATSDSIAGAIAFCPAGEQHLLWGLRHDELEMPVDERAFGAWLEEHDLRDAAELMGSKPLILIHAQGDEQIPYAWSEELYEHASDPRKLIIVPGGHHRSAQHDPELQSVALRWLLRALR
jgi:pimeloyl-ACP methyl ester carboxylesterase